MHWSRRPRPEALSKLRLSFPQLPIAYQIYKRHFLLLVYSPERAGATLDLNNTVLPSPMRCIQGRVSFAVAALFLFAAASEVCRLFLQGAAGDNTMDFLPPPSGPSPPCFLGVVSTPTPSFFLLFVSTY